MTALAFHFGAPDKVAYTCRLLRKAVGSGARVLVLAGESDCRRLDSELWALSPTDFIAHCDSRADAALMQRSPVLLAAGHADALHQLGPDIGANFGVMVNLTDNVPEGFDLFERVIEVVSTDEADRQWARQRWKQYTQLGYSIQKHDLQLRGAN